MTSTGRLDKLYPALSARERALLVLQAWKEDAEEDRLVRSTMPATQAPEFNRYIALMNAANQRLGPLVFLLHALVEQLGLRYGWLLTLQLWDLQDLQVALALAEGNEPAKGKNARQEAQVEQALFERLIEAFKDSPVSEDLAALRPSRRGRQPHRGACFRSELRQILLAKVREGAQECWRQMRAVELVLAETTAEFDGEDPALPDLREMLHGMREELLDLQVKLGELGEGFELGDPDEERVSRARRLLCPELADGLVSP